MGLGKWIVGAIGWAMLGPIGGILGYYLTSKLEKLTEEAEAVRLDDGRNVQGGGKRGRGRWEESQCLGLGYN